MFCMSSRKKANKNGLQQKMFNNKSSKILFYWCKGYRFFLPFFTSLADRKKLRYIKTLIGAIPKSNIREQKTPLFSKK